MTIEIYINGVLAQTDTFVATAQGQSRTITVSRGGETVGEVVITCDDFMNGDGTYIYTADSWAANYVVTPTPATGWMIDDEDWTALQDYRLKGIGYDTWEEFYGTYQCYFKDGIYTTPYLVHDPSSGLLVSTGGGGSLVNAN